MGAQAGRDRRTNARHRGQEALGVSGFYRYAVNEDVIGRNPVAAVRRLKVGSDAQSTGLDRNELVHLFLERTTGFEPATVTLARC